MHNLVIPRIANINRLLVKKHNDEYEQDELCGKTQPVWGKLVVMRSQVSVCLALTNTTRNWNLKVYLASDVHVQIYVVNNKLRRHVACADF